MPMSADQLRAFDANREVTERGALAGARDDSDVLRHEASVRLQEITSHGPYRSRNSGRSRLHRWRAMRKRRRSIDITRTRVVHARDIFVGDKRSAQAHTLSAVAR